MCWPLANVSYQYLAVDFWDFSDECIRDVQTFSEFASTKGTAGIGANFSRYDLSTGSLEYRSRYLQGRRDRIRDWVQATSFSTLFPELFPLVMFAFAGSPILLHHMLREMFPLVWTMPLSWSSVWVEFSIKFTLPYFALFLVESLLRDCCAKSCIWKEWKKLGGMVGYSVLWYRCALLFHFVFSGFLRNVLSVVGFSQRWWRKERYAWARMLGTDGLLFAEIVFRTSGLESLWRFDFLTSNRIIIVPRPKDHWKLQETRTYKNNSEAYTPYVRFR